MITFIESLLEELEHESIGTRKILALVPADKGDWKPHAKSMSMKDLAVHVADIPSWITGALTTDEIDFAATPYKPQDCNGGEELVAFFDKNVAEATNTLKLHKDEILEKHWTMRSGEAVLMKLTKLQTIRHAFGQMIHHRAQLGVYLRLLDIPIPGVYGPSADEMGGM